jgi:Cytochrome oxidase complex assembly protein 1
MTLPPHNPPPPAKPGKGPFFWIALGCGGCLTGVVIFVAAVYLIASAAMRQSTPLKAGLEAARKDPRVIATLGEPIETGFLFLGNINVENDDGKADIRVSLSGPKGDGMLHVVATKKDGVWTYQQMTATPDGGTPIDLLTPE